MSSLIRVVLADDHPLVRAGLRTVLAGVEGIQLVGEAVDGHVARRMVQELRPDVLLLDLSMPGPPAVETIAWLAEHCPQVKVLALTAYDDDAYVRGVVAAGVIGYVLKDEAPEAVVRAIRTVMEGDTWFSRRVVDKLVRLSVDKEDVHLAKVSLSERDAAVLKLIAQGWDNGRIAAELCVAEPTVRNYVSRIYTALGVRSRAEAIVWARENGYT